MKIVAIQADNTPCGEYRIGHIMEAMRKRGHTVEVIHSEPHIRMCNSWFAGYDIALIQRFPDPAILGLIDSIQPQWTPYGVYGKPKVVYEIDDLVWKLAPNRPAYLDYTHEIRDNIRQTIRGCDAVITSTPELSGFVSELNPNVYVRPNAIDFGNRPWGKKVPRHPVFGDKLVVGWAGGDRPCGEDFRPIKLALREFLLQNEHAVFCACGGWDNCNEIMRSCGIPKGRGVMFPPVSFGDYPELLSQFDIGIAPLWESPFNRCKSELKLLEYGATGIPYVASPAAPYARYHDVTSGFCGYLAPKSDDWLWALNQLARNPYNRELRGAAGRTETEKRYSLDQAVKQMERICLEIICNEGQAKRGAAPGDSGGGSAPLVSEEVRGREAEYRGAVRFSGHAHIKRFPS